MKKSTSHYTHNENPLTKSPYTIAPKDKPVYSLRNEESVLHKSFARHITEGHIIEASETKVILCMIYIVLALMY